MVGPIWPEPSQLDRDRTEIDGRPNPTSDHGPVCCIARAGRATTFLDGALARIMEFGGSESNLERNLTDPSHPS